MDESRKQFYEAFEELTGWEVNDCPNRDVVRLCHQMWEMSRAAIEIKWPSHGIDASGGTYHRRDDMRKELSAAGIKVKE